MPAVSLNEVTVEFGLRVVLDQVSLRADAATVLAIIGPSGVGKTTLLHVIGGLVTPSKGSVAFELGSKSRISWIVQNSPLLPMRTCLENVALGALAAGEDWGAAQSKASELLSSLGLEGVLSTIGYRLSGGEKQRVAVARAMAADASIILADEPTASLDAVSRNLVCRALRRAANRGSSVIVTTHDEIVASTADLVLKLEGGELLTAPDHRARQYHDAP